MGKGKRQKSLFIQKHLVYLNLVLRINHKILSNEFENQWMSLEDTLNILLLETFLNFSKLYFTKCHIIPYIAYLWIEWALEFFKMTKKLDDYGFS